MFASDDLKDICKKNLSLKITYFWTLLQIEIRLAFVYLESLREPRETRPSRPLLDRIIQANSSLFQGFLL